MTANKTYLTVAETAKLVRKALKADFPGVKFSVRSKSYSGGASVTAYWTDGPTQREVEGTLGLYASATFDGMQDLKNYHDTLLMTDDGPRYVHMGADFVHGSRSVSEMRTKLYEREVRRFLADLGYEWTGAERPYPIGVHDGQLSHDPHGSGEWGSSAISQLGWQRPWKGERCPGGDGAYCPGCGRWQRDHNVPHLH